MRLASHDTMGVVNHNHAVRVNLGGLGCRNYDGLNLNLLYKEPLQFSVVH